MYQKCASRSSQATLVYSSPQGFSLFVVVDNAAGICYSRCYIGLRLNKKGRSVADAFRITWQSLKDLWDEFVLLIMLNVIWSLSILLMIAPLFLWGASNPILALALSFVLFWPLPIISGALCFVTNQIAREKAVGWGMFVTGLRRYWAKSLGVAVINLIVIALIASNIQFYGFILQGTWTNFALSIWLIIGLYWLITQIYWFPMILELESEKVLEALRNALVLVIISPAFSVTAAIILTALTILCIVLTVPLPLFMTVLLLLISNRATRDRLGHIQKKREGWEKEKRTE